jgi:RNA polymerase Rpb1, domain 3
MVPRNIVSPQSNKPVMGIVQDSLLAGECSVYVQYTDTHRNSCVCQDVPSYIST